ncbi:M67 family metallopeptidase [Paenibacillus sp. N3/727]|uniref:M67 family metallopeptidase n=1 Tax=Paenibacillus sp. N3/727 TaxID=2925845 RepID=UPI001F538E39|nr:M67 family metallopeptidase [Paenibacillus sp. N3/727]UNK17065.1 M67 family metallopeptidase [Paenibacillus sp. N3/727]
MSVHTHDEFSLQLTAEVLYKIREQTFTCLPEEACGVLLGTPSDKRLLIDDYIPVRNTAADPQHHFSLDPALWTSLLFSEQRICGLFHSHPTSLPLPSQEDFSQLHSFGSLLKVYLIGSPQLSQPDNFLLNAYRIVKDYSPPQNPSRSSQETKHWAWTLRQEDYTLLRST